MVKIGVVLFVWLAIFSIRIIQIGGLDPNYKDPEIELFKPFRDYLVSIVDKSLPYPQSALLAGILLGNRGNLPFSLKNDLKITSTIHMVVVSGQNLTMLAGAVMVITTILGRKKTLIFTLGTILFYSLLTGFQVPVIRAALMAGITYLAQILGKESKGWWVLCLVAGGMLLFNPHWLLNISFQLSFLATLGVVVVSPLVVKQLRWVPKILKEDLSVTLSAQAMVLPIIAYNFGQISLIGILVNSLILWSIPIVMVSGLAVIVLGVVNIFLGQLAGLIPGALLTYFIYLVQFFSKIPGASINIGETGILMWAGYYLILGAVVYSLRLKQKK